MHPGIPVLEPALSSDQSVYRTQRSIYSPGEHSKDTVEDACVGYNDSGQAFLLMAEARDRGQLSMLPISGTNQPVRIDSESDVLGHRNKACIIGFSPTFIRQTSRENRQSQEKRHHRNLLDDAVGHVRYRRVRPPGAPLDYPR